MLLDFTLATQMFVQLLCTLLLILVIFEYEVLLLKVVCFGSECTRIDLRAFKFQKFSWGSMPSDPLVWEGFIVYPHHLICQPPPPIPNHLLMPLHSILRVPSKLILPQCVCYESLHDYCSVKYACNLGGCGLFWPMTHVQEGFRPSKIWH